MIRQSFVNRALPSLHGGSLEITLTVPLRKTKQETRAEVILMGKLKEDMDFLGKIKGGIDRLKRKHFWG